MNLIRMFPLVATSLVLIGIAAFCVATGQVTFLIVTGTVAALSWYVCEGPRGFTIPKWIANILIIVASVAMVPDLLANRADVLHVLGRYTVLIALIKLYERKDRRDYAQLLWLSLVLVIAGVLESRELLFGIALLLYSGLAIFVLLLYQLWSGYEAAQEHRRAIAPREAGWVPSIRPVFGRTVRGQFVATTAAVVVVGLFAAAILFASYPREIGQGMVQRLLDPVQVNRTGNVSEVTLRTGSRISDSRTPVFEIRVLNPEGQPVEYAGPLYLRGAALPLYDTSSYTWVDVPGTGVTPGQAGPIGFTSLATFNTQAGADTRDAFTIEFTPLASMGNTVFALASPVGLSTERQRRFSFDHRSHAIELAGSNRLDTYAVRCDPFPDEATLRALNGGRPAGLTQQRRYSDPRVRTIALQLLRNAGLSVAPPSDFPDRGNFNRRAARVIEQYLVDNFRYTLDLANVSVEGDPIVGFLDQFKRGHCEYFAAAMTALCQSVGIEARLVTGFLGSEYEGDGYYRIREANAHAWVEVRTSQYGYSTFDPTPPSAIEQYHLQGRSIGDRVRGIYEAFEAGWIQNIVEFDDTTQSEIQQTFTFDSFAWIDDRVREAAAWLTQFVRRFGFAGLLQILVVSSALIVATIIVVQLVRRARRVRKVLHLEHLSGAEYRRLLRQLGFYLDMLDVLKRAGLKKPSWQPPLAFADAISAEKPAAVGFVREMTDTFYAARYGGRELSHEEIERMKKAVSSLASALNIRWK